MPTKNGKKRRKVQRSRRGPARSTQGDKATPRARFVGRDPSPVLDRYPPRSSGFATPPPAVPAPARVPSAAPDAAAGPASEGEARSVGSPPPPLISLERPFDLDEFARSLGENAVRVVVPREDLPEVLRRVTDFMGFGIYVYRISVRPAPSDLLKQFIVELERVDFSAERRDWVTFEEKGRSESPFGPGSNR